jgi:hypothetical protein
MFHLKHPDRTRKPQLLDHERDQVGPCGSQLEQRERRHLETIIKKFL